MVNFLLDKLTAGTGAELEGLPLDAVAELTTGKIESYTSLNGRKAYRMIYDEGSTAKADMVTILLELGIGFVVNGNNSENIKKYIRENVEMSDGAYEFVCGIIDVAKIYATSTIGMETMLAAIYHVFKAVETGAVSLDGALTTTGGRLNLVFKSMESSNNAAVIAVGKVLSSILGVAVDEETGGITLTGIMAFIKMVVSFVKKIISYIRNIF